MHNNDIENEASVLIDRFEHLKNVDTSADWERGLHAKLAAANSRGAARGMGAQYVALAIAAVVLNAGFLVAALGHRPAPDDRTARLHTISRELFVNTSSVND